MSKVIRCSGGVIRYLSVDHGQAHQISPGSTQGREDAPNIVRWLHALRRRFCASGAISTQNLLSAKPTQTGDKPK